MKPRLYRPGTWGEKKTHNEILFILLPSSTQHPPTVADESPETQSAAELLRGTGDKCVKLVGDLVLLFEFNTLFSHAL